MRERDEWIGRAGGVGKGYWNERMLMMVSLFRPFYLATLQINPRFRAHHLFSNLRLLANPNQKT